MHSVQLSPTVAILSDWESNLACGMKDFGLFTSGVLVYSSYHLISSHFSLDNLLKLDKPYHTQIQSQFRSGNSYLKCLVVRTGLYSSQNQFWSTWANSGSNKPCRIQGDKMQNVLSSFCAMLSGWCLRIPIFKDFAWSVTSQCVFTIDNADLTLLILCLLCFWRPSE